jgi:hypothetical protein
MGSLDQSGSGIGPGNVLHGNMHDFVSHNEILCKWGHMVRTRTKYCSPSIPVVVLVRSRGQMGVSDAIPSNLNVGHHPSFPRHV